MKTRSIIAAAFAAFVAVILAWFRMPARSDVRGVSLPPAAAAPRRMPTSFEPAQSAALFVGVRKFTDDDTLEVPYAADDAVDLAYAFAMDPRVALVRPSRVVIAISGVPQKKASKERLKELKAAGATTATPTMSNILILLQQQAALAGHDGIFIASFATHGFVRNGVPYILGSSSVFRFPQTALATPALLDIAATSDAARSLVFLDACRERIVDNRAVASPDTAAPLISRMRRIAGQAVFYAAAAGEYAWDDEENGNGVFTEAVIEALHCRAATTRGAVTVATLHAYVERTVRHWIRQQKKLFVGAATQVSMDGDTRNMPLCTCAGPPPSSPPGDITRAAVEGTRINAFAADGSQRWSRELGGAITKFEVADLDVNGSHEVVAGAGTSLKLFDRAGNTLASADETMPLQTFDLVHLVRGDPTLQIVAVWSDPRHSTISTYAATGQRLATFAADERIRDIVIGRPTNHHNQRIIAIADRAILLLDANAKPLWHARLGSSDERLSHIAVSDRDKYSREITVSTKNGEEMQLDFDGNVLERSSRGLILNVSRH